MAYPTSKDDLTANQPWVDGTTIVEASKLNNIQSAVDNLQDKVGIDGSTDSDSLDKRVSDLESGGLGSWQTKSNSTAYQAATDGFVVAYSNGLTNAQTLIGYSDSNSSPTTVRQYQKAPNAYADNVFRTSIMFPVRKGDYWKVTCSDLGALFWIPLGS